MAKQKNQIKEITVRSPEGGTIYQEPISGDVIPYEGKRVPLKSFWKRRLRDGDVVTGKSKRK